MDKIILFGTLIVVFLVYVLYEIIHRHKLNDAPLYGSVKLICQLKGGDFDDGGDWLCEFEIDGKMASGVVYINDANAKPGDIHQGFYDSLSLSIPCILLQKEDEENDTTLYKPVKLICRLKGGDFDDGDWLCEFEIDGKMASGVVYINDANAKPGDIHQGFYDGLSVSIPCIFLQEEDDEDMNE